MSKKYPHVYLDIMIGSEAGGRIVFELFSDLTPRTAENFKSLCTVEYGTTTIDRCTCKLSYQGSQFHGIVDGFIVQSGDIVIGDGTAL
jgi:cyclophilin family peptidyl-prolyl cis-trans isomerase